MMFDISDPICELSHVIFEIVNIAGQIDNANPTIIQITIRKISDFVSGSLAGYFLFNSISSILDIKH